MSWRRSFRLRRVLGNGIRTCSGALAQRTNAGGLATHARHAGQPSLALWTRTGAAGQQMVQTRRFAGLPPHEELKMPALSPTMNQGNILEWKKKEGESIAPGDVICVIETDKATLDWEAQEEGVLAKILVQAGARDVPVGKPVAVLVEDEGAVASFANFSPKAQSAAGSSGAAPAEEEPAESSGGGGGQWPVHQVAQMPALSPTMNQGNILEWKKNVGDTIAPGDVICVVETDKATIDWEAQEEGVIAQLLVPAGTKDIPVGKPVMILVEDEADVKAFANFTAADAEGGAPKPKAKAEAPKKGAVSDKAPKKEEAPKPAAAAAPQPRSAPSPGGRVVATPYSRKLAQEKGVSLSQVQGSGPNGCIVAADVAGYQGPVGAPGVAAAVGGALPAGDYRDVPVSQIRRVIARRLLESKQTIPHYYLTVDVSLDKLTAVRKQLNDQLASRGTKLSVNDFVVKAAALALREVPEMNASWQTEFIRQYTSADVTVAVQTDSGLMVPVVKGAHNKGLTAISAEVKDLAAKAKEGKLKPHEMEGGTFTVSNLGMFGIRSSAGVINPPQAGILAVGAARPEVVMTGDGGFRESQVVSCTVSCDHRVVDGAVGAQWLQAFKRYMEDPITMIL